MATIEAGEIVAPTRDATYLVAYVRTIGAKTGDVQKLTIEDSENHLLVENRSRPLEKDKAQAMMFVGTKAPTGGWPSGIYRATYTVARDTAVVLQHTFSLKI